ncbi:phosphohexomutase domain-containing protein [Thioalkalivibrio thiocyanodenitrificans]|uniref:phosphomannomutase/phosphoglucomutase n=1 Tax=Thioalkalivibrio thiocyanodenitrificans TaxID=243063 RepID=UPI00037A3335|nr:phosphomannomutase/phosphoglucomutase [Thioalkalivibrio thiocyanodenitrificans]
MSQTLPCFKAYDIRGRIPDELNPELAYRIGRAYARVIGPSGPVAVGQDMRLTSPELAEAVIRGLNDAGVDTRSLGLCGTEIVYHAASLPGMGGGIMVTASHNPIDYNGMKLVREEAIPISGDSGLREIEQLVRKGEFPDATDRGRDEPLDVIAGYVRRVLSLVDVAALQPLHLVVDAGNGAAGPVFDAIAEHLPFQVTRIHHEPDGRFPNGIPNPLLPENRAVTANAVRECGADMGIAWDGDFDRCFLFDADGRFIEGYYLVGLLAEVMLAKYPGAKIIHDPRLTWNTIEQVTAAGGIPVMSKTGHAFIKERMRLEDAVYGGEMSAHHYFRDFAYCDSGMIPWLLITERMCASADSAEGGKPRPLADLVDARMAAYPCSGEINFHVDSVRDTIARIESRYQSESPAVDRTDGLSMEFDTWRFNLRGSNTEPVIRLNVETRRDADLLKSKTIEIRDLIVGSR